MRHTLRARPSPPAARPGLAGRVFWMQRRAGAAVAAGRGHRVQALDAAGADNLKVTGSSWPASAAGACGEFLAMVARETWRTVAIATAGITLALVLAMPLTLLSTAVLSVSALSGRMARGPFWLRQAVRWLLIVLRSVPELVWALVFVRVVGLGPTAGVLAIALTYGGMLGKVYGEILESGEPMPPRRCCATAAAACRPSSTACCRRTRPS
jgi:phosphonate transport system permease protein